MLRWNNKFPCPESGSLILGDNRNTREMSCFRVTVGIIGNGPTTRNHLRINILPRLAVENCEMPAITVNAQSQNGHLANQKALQVSSTRRPAIKLPATGVNSPLFALTGINSRQPIPAFANTNSIAINHVNFAGVDRERLCRARRGIPKNTKGQN